MVARSRYGGVDPLDPQAAGRCDRTGAIVKRSELVAEMRWAGNRLVPTGFLVRPDVADFPQPQDRVAILPPDPQAVTDPRFDIDAAQIVQPVLAGLGVLVAGGALGAGALFRRGHAPGSVEAFALGADGATYVPAAPDTPRFAGPLRRLLMEGAFENLFPNSLLAGAVPGTPGTLPDGWSVIGNPAWLSREVLAVGVLAGLRSVTVRWFSAAAGGSGFQVRMGALTLPLGPARSSVVLQRVGGALPLGLSFNMPGQGSQSVAALPTVQRRSLLNTVSIAATALQLNHLVTNGDPFDVTMTYAAPESGAGLVAADPVLPFGGMPAPSAVRADRLSAALGDLGVNGVTAFRLRWRGVLAAVPAGAQPRYVIEACDQAGTRERAAVVNLSGDLLALRVVTGGAAADVPLGAFVPGVEFEVVVEIGRDGGVSASLDGGPAVEGGAVERVLLALAWVGGQEGEAGALWGEVALARAEAILP